jgi:hypothetical protein
MKYGKANIRFSGIAVGQKPGNVVVAGNTHFVWVMGFITGFMGNQKCLSVIMRK